jgi:hypothetical protein
MWWYVVVKCDYITRISINLSRDPTIPSDAKDGDFELYYGDGGVFLDSVKPVMFYGEKKGKEKEKEKEKETLDQTNTEMAMECARRDLLFILLRRISDFIEMYEFDFKYTFDNPSKLLENKNK